MCRSATSHIVKHKTLIYVNIDNNLLAHFQATRHNTHKLLFV